MKGARRKLKIIVTAGPTREPIDPVRFISNYATGFLGYALAKEAKKRGHRVLLISGPTALLRPKGVALVSVETAVEMQRQLKKRFGWCDCLMMTAAIGDFRAKTVAPRKIKRGRAKEIVLRLKQNPDILQGLAGRKGKRMLVGFAVETEGLKRNAEDKLRKKRLDLLVATQIKTKSYPFGPARMDALIIDKKRRMNQARAVTKARLCRILLDRIENPIL